MLLNLLMENSISVLTNTALDSVTEEGIRVIDNDFKKQEIPADSVIIAAGLVCRDTPYEALWDKVDEVYRIGGCIKPGKVIDAIWDAYGRARII